MLKKSFSFVIFFFSINIYAKEIAITIDDPSVELPVLITAEQLDHKIREALRAHGHHAALFVCGMRVDNIEGNRLLKAWDTDGHTLANHSYSHHNFNSSKVSLAQFIDDFHRNEKLISAFSHFERLFRFPYLKEGDSVQKRDAFRAELQKYHYRSGGVTIDASDWYISQRLAARLKDNPKADISGYREYYLKHIWDRMQYYDSLAKDIFGRDIRHTLLLHHNLLNALFLDDLLKMIKSKGWTLVDAKQAFTDPVFEERPQIIPAGEGCVWALAKASGKYEGKLRYPAEDSAYEQEAMDRLGL